MRLPSADALPGPKANRVGYCLCSFPAGRVCLDRLQAEERQGELTWPYLLDTGGQPCCCTERDPQTVEHKTELHTLIEDRSKFLRYFGSLGKATTCEKGGVSTSNTNEGFLYRPAWYPRSGFFSCKRVTKPGKVI